MLVLVLASASAAGADEVGEGDGVASVEEGFSRDLAAWRRCSRSAISSWRCCWSLGTSMDDG